MKGPFISFEGVEGCGKTTQVGRLAERLRGLGREVVVVREPGGTPLAEEARRLVLDPALEPDPAAELFLMLVARADLVRRVVGPALARGATVLADRFDLSTRAYQIAGRGLAETDVLAANRLATGGLRPDLVVVLDLPPAVGRERQRAQGKVRDRMELEDEAFHRRVAEAFRGARDGTILHLAAEQSPEEIHRQLWTVLASRFPRIVAGNAG